MIGIQWALHVVIFSNEMINNNSRIDRALNIISIFAFRS